MASTTLSISHSPFFQTPLIPKLQNPLSISLSLSKPNSPNSITTHFQRLNLSPTKTLTVPKAASSSSGTEEFVRENPEDVIEKMKKALAEAQAAEVPKERAPRPVIEEIFAVVMIGSRQYIVLPGRWINTQRLKGASANDKIVLNKVLLVGTKDKTYIGKPVVTNAVVHAVVEEQLLDDKVIVFKYKAKKNYRRNIGHRQPITRIKITGITGYEDFPAATLKPQTVSS